MVWAQPLTGALLPGGGVGAAVAGGAAPTLTPARRASDAAMPGGKVEKSGSVTTGGSNRCRDGVPEGCGTGGVPALRSAPTRRPSTEARPATLAPLPACMAGCGGGGGPRLGSGGGAVASGPSASRGGRCAGSGGAPSAVCERPGGCCGGALCGAGGGIAITAPAPPAPDVGGGIGPLDAAIGLGAGMGWPGSFGCWLPMPPLPTPVWDAGADIVVRGPFAPGCAGAPR